MKARAHEGDFVAIPMVGRRYAVVRVLYVSKVFKKAMLLGTYDLVVSDPPSLKRPPDEYLDASLYTVSHGIEKGRWRVLSNEPLPPSARELTRRIVAGDVFVADENLGAASKEQLRKLPEMLTCGLFLAEKKVARLLEKHSLEPEAKEPWLPSWY